MATPRDRAPVVCGVDIGSTNTKVVGLDADGRVVARARRDTPRDPEDLSIDVAVLLTLVEEMIVEVAGTDRLVHAVAVAGVGEDGVLVGADRRPLGRALAWFDPRRGRILRAIRPALVDLEDLGVATNAARTLVGWAWAQRNGDVAHADAWVAVTDFAATAWTGAPFMSDTLAARTAAWDGRTRTWLTDRVLATLGDEALLPRVLPAGTVVGTIVSERLHAAGVLAPDAVAVAGGHDHPIGGWAVDRLHAGAILDSMGTAEVVVAQARTHVSRTGAVDVAPGILQGGTTLLCVAELARNIEWASLDPAVGAAVHALAVGDREPDRYVDAPVFVPGDQGGGRPRYALDAPADPLSRASAVLGALARVGTTAVAAVGAAMPADAPVFVAGGWSRAPGWLRIKERVAERRMQVVPEPEVTAVGAALLAATAIGWDPAPAAALAIPA